MSQNMCSRDMNWAGSRTRLSVFEFRGHASGCRVEVVVIYFAVLRSSITPCTRLSRVSKGHIRYGQRQIGRLDGVVLCIFWFLRSQDADSPVSTRWRWPLGFCYELRSLCVSSQADFWSASIGATNSWRHFRNHSVTTARHILTRLAQNQWRNSKQSAFSTCFHCARND